MIEVKFISELSKTKQKKFFQPWNNKSHSFLFFQLFTIIIALITTSPLLSHAAEVTLAWDSSDQASGYILCFGLESRTYEYMIDVGNNLQHTVTNLSENQLYYFAVKAYNDYGESEYSAELSYKYGNESPTADAGEDQTVDEGDTVILDGSYSSDPDDGIATYQWEQIKGTSVELSDSSAIEPSFIYPEVGANGDTMTFRLKVTDYSGVAASDTVKIYVNGIDKPPEYCEPKILISNSSGIDNVTLGNFSNTSAANGYSDFTSKVIEVEKAKPYLVSLSAEPKNFLKYWRVWADLNQDGDFDDPGEKLLESSKNDAISGQITIPTTALEGNTRLRISMGLLGYPNPCGNIYYGEVEDYTLLLTK